MRIKLMALSAICLLLSIYVSAQVNWVGAGDGVSWDDAANWSTGNVPAAGEDVILDNSIVLTSYDVNLPADATVVTVNSITIDPISPSLIRLLVPAANTAAPALHVTGAGDVFVLNTDATFVNSSASNIEVDGNFKLNGTAKADLSAGTGSPVLYVKGNFSVSSTNAITESGSGKPVVELNGNTTQNISSVKGAMPAGDIDFVVNTTGTVNLLTSVFLPHSLIVQAGTIDISNTVVNLADSLGVRGDLVVLGNIKATGTPVTGNPKLYLNGTTVQNITTAGPGSITGSNLEFILRNAAGAVLLSDLVLPFQYTISGGNITLGNFSLTTPFVSQAAPAQANHIITNGTGFLIIPNVVSNGTFPVGADATSVNEVAITNGEGLTYSIRVNTGINPPISLPLYALDRTWTINTNATPVNPINVTFYYYPAQGTPNFDYNANIDIGQYTPSAWSIIKSDVPRSGSPTQYQVSALINSFNSPFVIGNHGAILPLDFIVVCKAQKRDAKTVINWQVGNEEIVSHFEIEKSVNGSGFKTIVSILPDENSLSYHFDDNSAQDGNSFYRVKVILNDGKIRYSNIVALAYSNKAMFMSSIAPNPVINSATLTISSPGNTAAKLSLYDTRGRVVRQWQQQLTEGTTIVPIQLGDLPGGIYFLAGRGGNFKMETLRIVKQ